MIQRLLSLLLLSSTWTLSGCVFVDRYTYLELTDADAELEQSGPIQIDQYVGPRHTIPIRYKVKRESYTVYLLQSPADPSNEILIWAESPSGDQLIVERTERSLAVPPYGACRHYANPTPMTIQFYDKCPNDLQRRFVIAFDVLTGDGQTERFETHYVIQRAGYWYTPDGP